MTTENPRVVRLTAGKMTEVNFGVSCGRSVSVHLCDEVFLPGQSALREEWRPKLQELAELVKTAPARVTIVHATAGSQALGRTRLSKIDAYLKQISQQAGLTLTLQRW